MVLNFRALSFSQHCESVSLSGRFLRGRFFKYQAAGKTKHINCNQQVSVICLRFTSTQGFCYYHQNVCRRRRRWPRSRSPAHQGRGKAKAETTVLQLKLDTSPKVPRRCNARPFVSGLDVAALVDDR